METGGSGYFYTKKKNAHKVKVKNRIHTKSNFVCGLINLCCVFFGDKTIGLNIYRSVYKNKCYIPI